MSYFKNKKAYSATCGWKRDYRNNDEKIHNTRNNLLIWGNGDGDDRKVGAEPLDAAREKQSVAGDQKAGHQVQPNMLFLFHVPILQGKLRSGLPGLGQVRRNGRRASIHMAIIQKKRRRDNGR